MGFKKIILRSLLYTSLTGLLLLLLAAGTVFFFKNKIIEVTVAQLNQYLATKIEVNPDIDVSIFENFPRLSLQFRDVKIYEHASVGQSQLASVEHLSFAFDFYNILHSRYLIEEINMKNGVVKIKVDSLGKVNYNILKSDSNSQKGNPLTFDLQKINLTQIAVSYHNIPANQKYDVLVKKALASLHAEGETYVIDLKTDATVVGVDVGDRKFFQDKEISTSLGLNINTRTSVVQILPSEIDVESAHFKVAGALTIEKPRFIDLRIEEKNGSLQTLLSLLPESFGSELRAYQSEGKVFFSAVIKGEIRNNQNPLIEANFGFRNATFFHPELKKKISCASLNGYFTNGHKRGGSTSALRLEKVSCVIGNQIITGGLIVNNFQDPFIKCNVQGVLDIKFLYDFYPIKTVKDIAGSLDIKARFSGRVADLKHYKTSTNVISEGEVTLINVAFKHHKMPYKIEGLNAEILFNNNDISISSLRGRAGNSDFLVNGFMKNAIANLVFHTSPMYVEADLKANKIDATQLLALIESTSSMPAATVPNGGAVEPKHRLDNVLCKINCDIQQLDYHKLSARRLKGEITTQGDELYLNNTEFLCAGGKVNTSCNLFLKKNGSKEIRTISVLTNINIDSLFYVFDDFGQSFITQKNLKGELSGNIDALFDVDKHNDIISSTAIANIDVQILNGELNNFEPLKKLSKFVEESKLSRIQFSELTNKIFIEEGIVHIPEMTIKSNVSEMSISGTHSFTQVMDYRLTLPLKNLHEGKRDSDEAFGAIAPDKRGNPRLFLTIVGTSDNYKIAYDKQRTHVKIKEDLKKEKEEFLEIFKKKAPAKIEKTVSEPAFFDFED